MWNHGTLSQKSAWNACRKKRNRMEWVKLVWKYCRLRVSVTMALVLQERNFSYAHLKRRGISLASVCHNCFAAEDDNDHLFCSCSFARDVWGGLFDMLQLEYPAFTALSQLQQWFLHNASTNNMRSKVLRLVFCTAVWKIWGHRNKALHRNVFSPSVTEIMWDVLHALSISVEELALLF
ncbi:uncharacterized protein LOC132277432 [Cornus florida]|uniref:uncharacterized protein LOC132277432 n=1 Tax=Cornus florida TaxID=4283 RepID=UPI00289F7BE1|nr:uncharacterized protein LOC132277432 [Cornus florida]